MPTFRDCAGRERTAFVRAPLVSVLPPGLPHALADEPGPRTLVLSIAAPMFAGLARAALKGAEPPLVEPHAAADPLLREIGNAVEDDLRRQRTPGAAYLESLVMVLAVHVPACRRAPPAGGPRSPAGWHRTSCGACTSSSPTTWRSRSGWRNWHARST